MHRARQFLNALDQNVYRLERAMLLIALVMMTALVFSDVIIRTFTRPVGKTASFLLWCLEGDAPLSPETKDWVVEFMGPGLFTSGALAMCIFAAHASRQIRAQRDGGAPPALLGSAVRGSIVFALLTAFVQVVVAVFPTGIAGAQKFALGFMVWAGFLGASLATRARRHIVIDAVKKKLDAVAFPYFAFIGGLVTAAFTGSVAYLAAFKSLTLIEEWHESEGRLHVFESLPVPEWVVTLALPTTLSISAARFLAHACGELLWGRRLDAGMDTHGIHFDELAEQPDAQPNDVSTNGDKQVGRVYGQPHRGLEGRLSAEGERA